jgi:RNA polymerase I-specific transcription initiation factor RRN3
MSSSFSHQFLSISTQRLHAAIASIIRICPKGQTELYPIMSSNTPFRTRPEAQLTFYYKQCLHVVRYVPSIQGKVLQLIVDKCLEMDVEIRIDDGGVASIILDKDGTAAENDDAIFELDEVNATVAAPLEKQLDVDEMANKLDSLMLLVFQYSEQYASGNASAVQQLYATYTQIFESAILITHKSKFVQFLVFYTCGLESAQQGVTTESTLDRDFCAKLIDILLDPYRATITRQSGACYLASFVSRSTFVCDETVCESVSALLRWAEAYLQSLDQYTMLAADSRGQCSLHSLFYTVCQSAFYIMCFRGVRAMDFFQKAAAETDAMIHPDEIDICRERWNNLCSHPLQPLKFCLESVRSEFLQLSKLYDLIDSQYLDKLVQDNVRMASTKCLKKAVPIKTPFTLESARQKGGVGGLGQGRNPLESFFPFDPYLLRRSHSYVEPFYNHWPGSIEKQLLLESEGSDEEDPLDDASVSAGAGSDPDSDDEEDDERQSLPMSLTSVPGATLLASTPEQVLRDVQRAAWTDIAAKRPRGLSVASVENGSW